MFKLLINRIWDHLAVCCLKVKYLKNEKKNNPLRGHVLTGNEQCLLP